MRGGIEVEPRRKSKRTRWIILMVVAVVVVVAVVWFVNERPLARLQQRRALTADPESNQIVTAFIGDLSAGTTASGSLLPQREAHLALGIAGRVEKVHVEVGDEVKAGDVLVQLETSNLERAVRSAEQALAIQEANLAQLRAGASEEEIAAARASVESARAGLASAKANLASAQAGLLSAKSALTQAELARDALADAEVIAEANLKSAKAGLESAQAQLDALLEGADAETLEQARLNLEQAKNSLWHAQLERDAVKGRPGTPDYLKKEMDIAVANAEIAVRLAEISYQQAQEGATEETIAAAQASVAAAEAQVINAQVQLDDVANQKAQAEAAVAQAQAAVKQAESMVAQAEAGVQQAEAAVAQAEANLAMLLKGASEEQIAIAEAQVEQARIALEEARDNLAKATLVAPFDGIVTAVYVEVGEWASGLAVDLMDPSSLEVVLDVDEMDIGSLSIGQQAAVTLESWPDEELTGKIISIAPKATKSVSEIATYEVHLSLDAGGLPVRAGMTANAELITAYRENALLVPNRAIIADRQAGKYYVNLIQGDKVVKTEVTIGLRDKDYTEITSGLQEGDRLLIGEVSEKLDFREGPPKEIRSLR